MRYVYQRLSTVSGTAYPTHERVRTETISTSGSAGAEAEVEVYVSMEQYDAIMALFGSPEIEPIPPDIATVFQHRGPFTVICDPRA